jgi:predicted nucleic acid-binding protein
LAVYFFDTSAIVKRYASESGSAWVLDISDPATGNPIYLARITEVETVSAITRQARENKILASDAASAIVMFRYDFFNHYRKVEITPGLIDKAVLLVQSYALRGYDAVQLAAAIQVNTDRLSSEMSAIILISADVELNAAAITEGLAVDDPNRHS